MNYLLLFTFFPLLLFSEIKWQTSQGEDFKAAIAIPSESILYNQNLHVTLVLRHPNNYAFHLEELKKNLLNHPKMQVEPFSIVDVKIEDSVFENMTETNLHFILEPQMAGILPLTFLKMNFYPKDPSQKLVTLFSEIFQIDVSLGQLLPSQLHMAGLLPLSPQIPLEMSEANYRAYVSSPELTEKEARRNLEIFNSKKFPLLETVLMSLVLLFFGLVLLNPIKRPAPKAADAKQKALQAIERLDKQKISPEGSYSQLADILRTYLHDRYQMDTSSMTEKELNKKIYDNYKFTEESKKFITIFFEKAGKIKFGQEKSSDQELKEAEKRIKQSISIDSNGENIQK